MVKGGVKVRRCFYRDLKSISEITKISFPENHLYSFGYFERCLKKHPETFIVAENKDNIIGYVVGRLENSAGKLISLAVEPNFRRNGIGTTLSNFLINHFQKRGAKKIFLRVRSKNVAVIDFYEKLDFKILKKIKSYYSNGDSAYLMVKNL